MPESETPASLLAEAKDAYGRGEVDDALSKNQQVVQAKTGDLLQVQGMRFTGLCFFRLGRFEESLKNLQNAKQLAIKLKAHEEAQFIANHLGATLRRMGKPNEALKVLEAALQRTSTPDLIAPRAHLIGNLGALYDEAGQRALADEHYARYEELCLLIGNKHRLANAHGFMSRVNLLRGRLGEAERHVEEEYKLATQVNDNGRIFTALRHQAKLAIAKAQQRKGTEATGLLDEASMLLDKAWNKLQNEEHHRKIMVLRAQAEIEELRGQSPAALARLESALKLAPPKDLSVAEQRASVLRDLARVAGSLRLSGEALFYLEQAAETRWQLLKSLKGNAQKIEHLYAPRFKELRKLVNSVLKEARTVPRDDRERQRLVKLLERLNTPKACKQVQALEKKAVLRHSARESTVSYWQQSLGDIVYGRLDPHSQDDLVRSDIVYHGAVADLGRAAHLVVVIFERELRNRFLTPVVALHKSEGPWVWKDRHVGKNIGLRATLNLIKLVVDKQQHADFPTAARGLFAHCLDALRTVLKIGQPLKAADGETISMVNIRNHVAHGQYDKCMPTRLDVDAFRRHLLFGDQSPLTLLTTVKPKQPS